MYFYTELPQTIHIQAAVRASKYSYTHRLSGTI